ncbi:MAG: AzlC family ABC transporter permease, partial [Agromyces sp.]
MDERTAADASAAGDGDGAAVERSTAVRDSLAVGLATAIYGVSFGALSVAAGLDIWQTCFLSLVMFTGGSQFA